MRPAQAEALRGWLLRHPHPGSPRTLGVTLQTVRALVRAGCIRAIEADRGPYTCYVITEQGIATMRARDAA
jgi:hypothetical protein